LTILEEGFFLKLLIEQRKNIALKLNTVKLCIVTKKHRMYAEGRAARPREIHGIEIRNGAHDNTIRGNIIAGNRISNPNLYAGGLYFTTAAHHNVVRGNRIGVNVDGNPLPNETGIFLEIGAPHDNIIGGPRASVACDDPCNVISGNSGNGIIVRFAGTIKNRIEGNYIGLNATGTRAVPNQFPGIAVLRGASENIIGGARATTACDGRCNVISGNAGNGVVLLDSGTTDNRVRGNFIGVDPTGTTAMPNKLPGIGIALGASENIIGIALGASENIIGGERATTACDGRCNVISGNGGSGIVLTDAGTSKNRIEGNYIGLNAIGTITVPNQLVGIDVRFGASENIIGSSRASVACAGPPTDISGPAGSLPNQLHQDGVVIISPDATLHGTIDLQGRPAKPAPSWAISLTVTLTPLGSSTPSYTFTTTTDQSGAFSLAGISPGRYDIRLKGKHTLRNLAQNVDLVSGENRYFLGQLLEGDVETAASFNQVVLADFGVLSGAFNSCRTETRFVVNADLDESGCVALADFGLLAGNFNRQGDILVTATPFAPAALQQARDQRALLAFNVEELAVKAGQIVTVAVEIDPRGEAVNGGMVHLRFDPALVEVVAVQPSGQLPAVLEEPLVDNQRGVVRFGAGLLGQTRTSRFAILTLRLRVKAATSGTTITPEVDSFPASDVSGPEGSVLGEAHALRLKPIASGQAKYMLFLPIVAR